jgi:hypothetical protein
MLSVVAHASKTRRHKQNNNFKSLSPIYELPTHLLYAFVHRIDLVLLFLLGGDNLVPEGRISVGLAEADSLCQNISHILVQCCLIQYENEVKVDISNYGSEGR